MTDIAALKASALTREADGLSQQLIDGAKRDGVDTYTKTLLWHASDLIDRQQTEIAERTANQAGLQLAWGEEREKVARLEAEARLLRSTCQSCGSLRSYIEQPSGSREYIACTRCDDEASKREEEIARLEAEVEALEKLVYVPGLWRCAKCDFTLVQANLNGRDGSVTARDHPGDKCPNCHSPLWRVTERQAGNDMVDRYERAEAAARAQAFAEAARIATNAREQADRAGMSEARKMAGDLEEVFRSLAAKPQGQE